MYTDSKLFSISIGVKFRILTKTNQFWYFYLWSFLILNLKFSSTIFRTFSVYLFIYL